MDAKHHHASWLIRQLTVQSVAVSSGLSLAFILSDPQRLSANAYWGVVNTGGSTTWGILFGLAAVTLAFASRANLRQVQIAMFLSALIYGALATTFALAVPRFPEANLTAPVVYGWLSWVHMSVAWRISAELKDGCDCL